MLREGFNSHGIGFSNNMIQSVRDSWGIGVPVTFCGARCWPAMTLKKPGYAAHAKRRVQQYASGQRQRLCGGHRRHIQTGPMC